MIDHLGFSVIEGLQLIMGTLELIPRPGPLERHCGVGREGLQKRLVPVIEHVSANLIEYLNHTQ
jgi:hypothetical protein